MNTPLSAAARAAARYGIVALLGASTLLTAQTTNSDETKTGDQTQKLEKFEVTGSRVKRLDYETPAPVLTFSAAEIEAKGYVNIGDFVQSLPFTTGNANSIYNTSSFQVGATTANVRGIGAQRVLTLVDGRRAAPLAQVSPNTGTRQVFDFNTLPAAAIESVEFLKDGASAIYGSDAISGVINVKLKKNFSGVSTSLYYGNTLKNHGGDTGTREFTFVAGVGNAKTRILTAFDVKVANSNYVHDYGVNSTDFSYLGANKGINQNSTSNYPANLTLTRTQAAAIGLPFPNVASTVSSWTYVVKGGQPIGTPTLSAFAPAPANPDNPNAVLIGNENRYNFAPVLEIYPAYDYISNYVSFEHEFTEKLKGFGSVSYSKNNTYVNFTPTIIGFSTEGLTLPANNPYNPFGIALTTLAARANFLPSRKTDVSSDSANILGGVRGTIFDRWDWESGVDYGYNSIGIVNRNYIRASVYQAALNGTTRQTAINPFGPSDNQTLVNSLLTTSQSANKASVLTWDASVTGKLFQLPAGDVGLAAGLEMRNEALSVNPDSAAYIGQGGGAGLNGKRTVASEYVEVTAPLYRTREFGSAEVQLAGRHEHYSDFGDTSKPKIGAKIRLPDTKWVNLILRGSYSESFQAPPLGLLYASQTVAFTPGLVQDPLRPQDPPTQLRVIQGGNPNLLPETARVNYAGTVIELPSLKNLSFSVDYFNIRLNQYIVTPGTSYLLSATGMAQFPNAIVRDNTLGNPGPILRIESVPSNNPKAYQLYRGVDYGVKYNLSNTRYGSFRLSADATQIIKIGTDSGLGGGFFNNAGYYNNPRWKSTGTVSWTYKDYGASVTADRIGKFFNDGFTVAGWGENPLTLVSTTVRYSGFMHSTITLGANNLFDVRPPPNARYGSLGMDTATYGPFLLGRFLFIRVKKDF